METLAEKIKKILDDKGLSQAMFAKRYGVNSTTVSQAINGRDVSNSFIKQLVNVLGDDFEQYYETTICEICGKEFIHLNGKAKFCSSDCQKEKTKQSKQRWVEQRDYVREMIRTGAIEKPIIDVKKRYTPPEKTIGEFMDGKSYGDRQREYLLNLQKTQRMEIR
mgnify:CR=1 FL=1